MLCYRQYGRLLSFFIAGAKFCFGHAIIVASSYVTVLRGQSRRTDLAEHMRPSPKIKSFTLLHFFYGHMQPLRANRSVAGFRMAPAAVPRAGP